MPKRNKIEVCVLKVSSDKQTNKCHAQKYQKAHNLFKVFVVWSCLYFIYDRHGSTASSPAIEIYKIGVCVLKLLSDKTKLRNYIPTTQNLCFEVVESTLKTTSILNVCVKPSGATELNNWNKHEVLHRSFFKMCTLSLDVLSKIISRSQPFRQYVGPKFHNKIWKKIRCCTSKMNDIRTIESQVGNIVFFLLFKRV